MSALIICRHEQIELLVAGGDSGQALAVLLAHKDLVVLQVGHFVLHGVQETLEGAVHRVVDGLQGGQGMKEARVI